MRHRVVTRAAYAHGHNRCVAAGAVGASQMGPRTSHDVGGPLYVEVHGLVAAAAAGLQHRAAIAQRQWLLGAHAEHTSSLVVPCSQGQQQQWSLI